MYKLNMILLTVEMNINFTLNILGKKSLKKMYSCRFSCLIDFFYLFQTFLYT